MTATVDEMLGFNPADLDIFQKQTTTNTNQNVYKTNPVTLSKSEDGHYHSKVKIIYNPFNMKQSIVHSATYAMNDENGFFMVDSKLAMGDKTCPIFTAWKKLWFAMKPDPTNPSQRIPDEDKKNWAKHMFDKNEANWVLIQILEDENQPELVGQFKVWKLPKSIYEKLEAKMHPSNDSKKAPQPIMDYVFGPALEIDATPGPDDKNAPERKSREISYSLCDFEADATPIIKIDGSPLFEDDEMETIEEYISLRNAYNKAKTEKAKNEKQAEIDKMKDTVRQLWMKAIDYVKENALDLNEECGYHAWDEATTARVNSWITRVLNMEDPTIPVAKEIPLGEDDKTGEDGSETTTASSQESNTTEPDDDLPF